MNTQDEHTFPDAVDEQILPIDEFSDQQRFRYSLERVEAADMHSLDRVWERLVTYVEKKGVRYRTSDSVVRLSEPESAIAGYETESVLARGQRSLRKRLDTLVTACILALLVGSMIFGFNIVQHNTGGRTASQSQSQSLASVSFSAAAPLYGAQTVEISIIRGEGGSILFRPAALRVSSQTVLVWHNLTTFSQVAFSEGQTVSLSPEASSKRNPGNIGNYVWHLQANPAARLLLTVFGTARVMIASSPRQLFEFLPGTLHLTTGSTLVWINATDQIQVISRTEKGGPAPPIRLAPQKYNSMSVQEAGSHSFRLESDPRASFVLVVNS